MTKRNQNHYILGHHPSLPYYPWPKNIFVDFFIDATNKQIFENYGTGSKIDKKFISEIILREQNAYKKAGNIFCMCHWAADSVINDYGIDHKKVHVIVGGANLDEKYFNNEINLPSPKEPNQSNPLIIGFIGKDWERKGGQFSINIVNNLNNLGIFTKLRVVGANKKDIPKSRFIEYVGFIDKNKDINKFVKELNSWHFASLFSFQEASPRSNLESLKIGVPILSHNVGGISSTFFENYYGKLFNNSHNK